MRTNSILTFAKKAVVWWIAVLGLLAQSSRVEADRDVLLTYLSALGQEVASLIAVSPSKLQPFLPPGYAIIPASALGVGDLNQGIVGITVYRGIGALIDRIPSVADSHVAIMVSIVVAEPAEAVGAGLSIPGAFHFYILAIYTNDPLYAAHLGEADLPVELVRKILYQRPMDDATGVGDMSANIPSKGSPFMTVTSGFGYALATGALNAVFWYNGHHGKMALHFAQPYRIGNAISQIYTKPASPLEALLKDGGSGPCLSDPETGYSCVTAPALNLRYDQGSDGTLLLIE